MFAVWENGQVGKKDAFKGYITLDLFPRNNKYVQTSSPQSFVCLLTSESILNV